MSDYLDIRLKSGEGKVLLRVGVAIEKDKKIVLRTQAIQDLLVNELDPLVVYRYYDKKLQAEFLLGEDHSMYFDFKKILPPEPLWLADRRSVLGAICNTLFDWADLFLSFVIEK